MNKIKAIAANVRNTRNNKSRATLDALAPVWAARVADTAALSRAIRAHAAATPGGTPPARGDNRG